MENESAPPMPVLAEGIEEVEALANSSRRMGCCLSCGRWERTEIRVLML